MKHRIETIARWDLQNLSLLSQVYPVTDDNEGWRVGQNMLQPWARAARPTLDYQLG